MHVAVRTNVVAVGEPHRLQTGRGVGAPGESRELAGAAVRGAGRAGGMCAPSEGRQQLPCTEQRQVWNTLAGAAEPLSRGASSKLDSAWDSCAMPYAQCMAHTNRSPHTGHARN